MARSQTKRDEQDALHLLKRAIELKNIGAFSECNSVLDRFLSQNNGNAHGHHELSLSMRYQGRQHASLRHAYEAALLEPTRHEFQIGLAVQLALTGRISRANASLESYTPKSNAHFVETVATLQFISFLEEFPKRKIVSALEALVVRGQFLDVASTKSKLLRAIAGRTPFSLIRHGDGEGAWTFLSMKDQAKFPDLYRQARLSFLLDWFGDSDLIDDDAFRAFAADVALATDQCKIVGITDVSRIDHEYRLGSQRGIPTCVNVLRKQNLIDANCDEDKIFCSNNVHHSLNKAGFFSEIFSLGAPVLLISSYSDLPQKLGNMGANIVAHFESPGDSRNFWSGPNGLPQRQWPELFKEISGKLRTMDLSGVVGLVAAGFVGKQYVSIVQDQGGVGIDIGGVADVWSRPR